MTRSIIALSFAAGLCAVSVGPANAAGHGGGGFLGGGGGVHGGGYGYRGGYGYGYRGYGGYGWWGPGVALGLGLGAIAAAPYYYPPPYYYPAPPAVYAPPQTYYQPPTQAYSRMPAAGGGQSCNAGAYVCPIDRPVATGGSCSCRGNNGQRVMGQAN
ncbi:MAG TPA: hypothetical protein VGM42_08440 [Rhodopila sp.]